MAYIGTQPKDVRSFGKAQFDFTATASQTVFSGADDDGKTLGFTTGQIQVYVNGILMDASDYTTSNGNTVTLASAANANDIITVVALQTDIPNSDYVPATGGTFSGAVAASNGLTVDNDGATVLTVDRATSDGTIIDVQRGGTSTAVIGVSAGDDVYFAGATGSSKGIYFNANGLLPATTGGSASDGTVDIGENITRWKDLYLSGTIDLSNDYTDTYILKSNHPTTGVYTATDGTHDHWITLKSYGGTHVVLNTDGVRTSGRNSQDHFTVWQKEKDHTNGRACFSVDNIGQAYFGSAGVSIDRGWGGYPSITVHRTGWNSNSNAALGEFRIHGYSGEEFDWWTGSQGSDFSVNLRIDGGTYISSDRRKKTDIESLSGAVDTVLQLDGKRFKIVNNEGTPENNFSQSGYKMGFIAQEIETVIPDAVKHYPDEDDGTDGYNNAYSVDYASIVALLTNAIKEQQATIQTLEARISALENN